MRERGRRAIVVVMDACGVGALPDAADYGDQGTNTLAHVAKAVGGLRLPTMQRLGLGCILPLTGVPASERPAIHGALHALGPGKDSTSGHWELMGAVLAQPLPTYPEGLPDWLLADLAQAMGHEAICNKPHNGIGAIEEFGAEHLRDGKLILYTSTDSVVQIAAHVDVISEQRLHAACEAARAALIGEHAVGRVIARPFGGAKGAFARTPGRRDFTLPTPHSYLHELGERGVAVHGVGKVCDLFGRQQMSACHPGDTNVVALRSATALLAELEQGLIFVNLIETDQAYGHRKDVEGFHRALQQIDGALACWLRMLRRGDLLILTADHGVDPLHPSGDHTREHAPLLALTGAMLERQDGPGPRHDGPLADVGASVLLWLTGDRVPAMPGEPFAVLEDGDA